MTKDVRVYLAHILESIDKIERFTTGTRLAIPARTPTCSAPRMPRAG